MELPSDEEEEPLIDESDREREGNKKLFQQELKGQLIKVETGPLRVSLHRAF